jgi:hypothetical protein
VLPSYRENRHALAMAGLVAEHLHDGGLNFAALSPEDRAFAGPMTPDEAACAAKAAKRILSSHEAEWRSTARALMSGRAVAVG